MASVITKCGKKTDVSLGNPVGTSKLVRLKCDIEGELNRLEASGLVDRGEDDQLNAAMIFGAVMTLRNVINMIDNVDNDCHGYEAAKGSLAM